MPHAYFVPCCILNPGLVASAPSVIRARIGNKRIVQEHRLDTLIIFVIYVWN